MAQVPFRGNVRIDLVVKKSRCVHGYFDFNSSFFNTWEIFSLYMRRMTNYIDLNWKTEEKLNIGSKYQPPVYHNVDKTGIS